MSVESPGSRKRTVAIIDDDASVRMSLRRLCEAFGLRAAAFASGREFLTSLDEGGTRADCLLLDSQMPDMSGFEVQRELVELGVHIPTIICTAGDATEAPVYHGVTGFVEYLRKPISANTLLAAIHRAFESGESTSSVRR